MLSVIRSRMKTLLALLLLGVPHLQAQILIYKGSFKHTAIGHGFTTKRSEPRYLVVDASTGMAAQFRLILNVKNYFIQYKTLTVNTVNGGLGKDYMIFAEGVAGTENSGQPYKYFSTAKGLNVSLDVGLPEKRSVARTLQSVGRYVYSLGIEPFINEDSGTLTIDLAATRTANTSGQTLDDVVASIHSSLVQQGYFNPHP